MTSIHQYRNLVELHSGPLSTVWSAIDNKSINVVLKGYHKIKMKTRHIRNVIREKRLLQVFNESRCRGVVKLLRAFEDDECVYLVFEPAMKGDLYQVLLKHHDGIMREDFAATHIIAPLLSTLSLLHQLGIVHRDVKSENCFLSTTGELLLGDFGLAAHKEFDNLVERVGTLDYMAPEVLSMPAPMDSTSSQPSDWCKIKSYDEKVDVWAVGILLHEILTGRTPFEVEDATETAAAIMGAPIPLAPISHLPSDCRDFISVALSKQADQRPQVDQLMRHAWLQRHLRGQAPNAGPRLQSFDIFEVSQMRRAINEAWNLDELERSLGQLTLFDPNGDNSLTSSLAAETSRGLVLDSIPSSPSPEACSDMKLRVLTSPSSSCGSTVSGALSPEIMISPQLVGETQGINQFRSSHSFKVLSTERVSWSAVSAGSFAGLIGATGTAPPSLSKVPLPTVTVSPPELIISAYNGAHSLSPTGSEEETSSSGVPISPQAWGVNNKPRLPTSRSRFGSGLN